MKMQIPVAWYWIKQHRIAFACAAVCLALGLIGLIDLPLATLFAIGASTSPAFASVPPSNFTPGSLTAANTALDGTGTTLLIATAPAVTGGGSVVERVRCMHKGTNVATVVRVFLNNGSTPATAGNNTLIAEKTIPANTLTQTAESIPQDIVINQLLKGHATTPERLYVAIGTAVAAGVQFTAIGGDL